MTVEQKVSKLELQIGLQRGLQVGPQHCRIGMSTCLHTSQDSTVFSSPAHSLESYLSPVSYYNYVCIKARDLGSLSRCSSSNQRTYPSLIKQTPQNEKWIDIPRWHNSKESQLFSWCYFIILQWLSVESLKSIALHYSLIRGDNSWELKSSQNKGSNTE